MRVAALILLGITVVAALPTKDGAQKIVGGSLTTIQQYPFMAALLTSPDAMLFRQSCGGTILNNRSILSAAHCFMTNSAVWQWRARVGSSYASSGGTVHRILQIIRHPRFSRHSLDMDFAILRLQQNIEFRDDVSAGVIAGPNYNPADNEPVWATGWGTVCFNCAPSQQLREVQVYTINQETCRELYAEVRRTVTENMICSGILYVGGRDQCHGDSGGPLLHNGVVIGVSSWGILCAQPRQPGVNARVSSASPWIISNA